MRNFLKLKGYLKPYWPISLLALFLLVSVAAMDLAIPRLIQRIIDDGIAKSDQQVVITTTLIMLGITVLSALFATGNSLLSVRVGEGFARDLRMALFKHIQSLSFGNLDRLQTGGLLVRLTSDINIVQRVVQVVLRIGTRAPLLMIGSMILLVLTSLPLALMIFPLLVITALTAIWFVSRMQPLFRSVQRRLDRMNTILQENLAGIRVVKAFVRSDFENQRFQDANQDYTRKTISVMQFTAFLMPSMSLFVNLGILVVIWAGGLRAIQGAYTLGEIVAFTNYLMTTITPLAIMAMIAAHLAGAGASAERILEVMLSMPDVQDRPEPLAVLKNGPGRVVFEGVNFHYNGLSSEPILQGVELVAEAGETVAILGATGAGKTSLVNLIPRFYDVNGGRVTLDGQDVRDLGQVELQAQIGIVLQDTVLFRGTIRDNILYGCPQAGEEQVVAAAKAAQAHDFITQLPEGYDTLVEERGVNLSGGQKQRIAIARAILLDPKVLILDDSTSSVDVDTEARIQETLAKLRRGRTSFVVAQRISTVLNADKIVVLDQGRVAAQGTHAELLRNSLIYQEIYASQLGDGVVNHV